MNSPTRLLGLALASAITQPACAAVFFAAHQDDLVLLMARSGQLDIKANTPTVIVVMTAGDAGNGVEAASPGGLRGHQYNQQGNPYYRVRHNAHEAALASWVPAGYSTLAQRSTEHFGTNLPAVETVRIGNVLIYNLNLPDGSLQDFHEGKFPVLFDVTGANGYTPAALRRTLRLIIRRNNAGLARVVINQHEHTPEHSEPGYNADRLTAVHVDHSDHTAAGRLVRDALDAMPAYGCVHRVMYMGYAIAVQPDTMSEAEKQSQVAAFAALDQVLKNQGNITYNYGSRTEQIGSADPFHTGFFGKQRWRTKPGACACAF